MKNYLSIVLIFFVFLSNVCFAGPTLTKPKASEPVKLTDKQQIAMDEFFNAAIDLNIRSKDKNKIADSASIVRQKLRNLAATGVKLSVDLNNLNDEKLIQISHDVENQINESNNKPSVQKTDLMSTIAGTVCIGGLLTYCFFKVEDMKKKKYEEGFRDGQNNKNGKASK